MQEVWVCGEIALGKARCKGFRIRDHIKVGNT